MGRSQNSFIKAQKQKEKLRKRHEKELKKKERQENNAKGGSLQDMMAYIDENGNISNTPPEEVVEEKKPGEK